MLEVLTPLSKCVRTSRAVAPSTFVAAPGIWGWIDTDGSIKNQTNGTIKLINKLVMTSASSDKYESQDVEAGRITTLEGPAGVRCHVDSACCYSSGGFAQGDLLIVSVDTAYLGKLITTANATQTGTYNVVGRVEQVIAANEIIFELITGPTVTK